MRKRVVIERDAVYELDEECLARKRQRNFSVQQPSRIQTGTEKKKRYGSDTEEPNA